MFILLFVDETFNILTSLAAQVFKTEIMLITLVDLGNQWFLSKVGLPDEVKGTPRCSSFCNYTIKKGNRGRGAFIVPDARADPRFAQNALVTGPPFIRYYCGVPLMCKDGHCLGSFCAIDSEPRVETSLEHINILKSLAIVAITQMNNKLLERQTMLVEKSRYMACTCHDLITPLVRA